MWKTAIGGIIERHTLLHNTLSCYSEEYNQRSKASQVLDNFTLNWYNDWVTNVLICERGYVKNGKQ